MPPEPADLRAFIVTLSVPVATFRHTLMAAVPDAQLGRELPHDRVVAIVPVIFAGSLAALPGVRSVVPDELRKKLRHDQPGDSRD